jgi:hypothetical protein
MQNLFRNRNLNFNQRFKLYQTNVMEKYAGLFFYCKKVSKVLDSFTFTENFTNQFEIRVKFLGR